MSKVLVGFEPGLYNSQAIAANGLTTGLYGLHNRGVGIRLLELGIAR